MIEHRSNEHVNKGRKQADGSRDQSLSTIKRKQYIILP